MKATCDKIEYDTGMDEYYVPISVDDGKRTFRLRLDASSICPHVGVAGRKLLLWSLASKVVCAINRAGDGRAAARDPDIARAARGARSARGAEEPRQVQDRGGGETMNKYELTEETRTLYGGTVLHRIRALRDIELMDGMAVRAGDPGGWVEREGNLSQDGSAWVGGEAVVYEKARVCENAWVYEHARIYGSAEVSGKAVVYGKAEVYDEAVVYDEAWVGGEAAVGGEAEVCGKARILGKALVYGCEF